jgi:hypothetical protein
MPTIQLLEQGLQVPATFQILIHPGNIEANHNDQIRITAPATSRYYNKKYRVIGLTEASSHPMNDRNLIKFILKRWEASHGEAYQ